MIFATVEVAGAADITGWERYNADTESKKTNV